MPRLIHFDIVLNLNISFVFLLMFLRCFDFLHSLYSFTLHHSFCCHVTRRTFPYADVFRFSIMVQTFAMRTGVARNSTDCMNAT